MLMRRGSRHASKTTLQKRAEEVVHLTGRRAGDHGRDRHAGLLLRVHRHLQRARAGLFLLRHGVHQALPGTGGQQRRPARPAVRPGGRAAHAAGVYTFGLFTVDIFVNAGQVVTGNLAPYFLTVCKPNYTALGCQQALRYISHQEACTGNQDDILRARKTFPSKEAALSVYAALYLAMYVTCTVQAKGTRLAKPVLSLGLMCLAFLTGLNRVAEYRNHWSDVIAGFIIGTAIAAFLVVCVVHNFKGKLLLSEDSPEERSNTAMLNMGRMESPLEKYIASQNHIAFAEVT
ncbi:phospholipid phosphatase-related protein type 5 isoform X4 [Anarrhichthys ocellatus]|uniref:phospholipid phosphatase-related protein type 5 isoform X4 n=1 Tax=Anarrhichthys ocellatus TaxID=433405 RepID=UPI0012EE9040|nr:phospholipid phosphatase-related protein type 5 isoform X4 [Anarrhichthys ocellatus]XP_031729545.1 phospholipid phosphatase-related protein type 5 isoform X4 [Anarrhichthys ocellatus]